MLELSELKYKVSKLNQYSIGAQINQQDRTKSSEIDPSLYGNTVYKDSNSNH